MFDSLSKARLQWMFDNEPEYVKELLDKKQLPKLERSILDAVIPAINLENQLRAKGKSFPEAREAALEALIPKDGPEFSDDPPKPLSLKDQRKVLDILEQREEFRDRQHKLEQK